MYSSLSICGASCGLHVREEGEDTNVRERERERENTVSRSEFNLHSPQASMDGCLYLKIKINLRVAPSDALKSHLLSMGALSIN